ncbi:hypothetical protein LTR36_003140 [Oleoguttula mirabilis]|uniref:Uncharacterized protein n=1 Tax=Oleoguttula mirabilis TaxID=1507867 RepID=A0AAV9JZV6_9PEZI|nr:hypothetical protein LTR36_003140 [Oleoguttula mirabilis]
MERLDAIRLLQTQRDIANLIRPMQLQQQQQALPANPMQRLVIEILSKTTAAQDILLRSAFQPSLTLATNKVLSTFELVERILLGLGMHDILFATQYLPCDRYPQVVPGFNIDRTSPWLVQADVAAGSIIIFRKDGYEIFLFIHMSGNLPMRVLHSRLKRTYCDAANLHAGIKWYDISGQLVCSKDVPLLERQNGCASPGLDNLPHKMAEPLKAYLWLLLAYGPGCAER